MPPSDTSCASVKSACRQRTTDVTEPAQKHAVALCHGSGSRQVTDEADAPDDGSADRRAAPVVQRHVPETTGMPAAGGERPSIACATPSRLRLGVAEIQAVGERERLPAGASGVHGRRAPR